MASEKWVSVKQEWCDLLQQEVVMLERRVFPDDVIPGPQNYRVIARKCSADTTCNMAGYPCKWAYTNPNLDPFVERAQDRLATGVS